MKSKLVRRVAAIASSAVLAAGAVCMFAGCTSKHPLVTVTYSFNGKEYAVEYELSRLMAPQTVQHFIELADAGWYEGTCIHDYNESFMYGGGYTVDEDGELQEKDYFAFVKGYEADHDAFTQSVRKNDEVQTPLYTVYGEFSDNGCVPASVEYKHERGALVMYYTDKSDTGNFDVVVDRADSGKGNDGEKTQLVKYSLNSATSLFYTCLNTDSSRDSKYAVFGKVTDLTESGAFEQLIAAISSYRDALEEGVDFTVTEEPRLDTLDHVGDDDFANVRGGNNKASFSFPKEMPIVITSVTVDKY